MKRVLITGAKGMLGLEVSQTFAPHFEILSVDIDQLDVREAVSISATFNGFQPDLVIHLAALTDVDACEKFPEQAYAVNTVGTQLIALACQKQNCPLVYLSSVSVFGGAKPEAYTEFDTPQPVSHYSRSKYQGELVVQNLLNRYYIVRAGWMFGGALQDKKFVARILELARACPTLQIVDDKFGSPTYTRDLAQALLSLVKTELYGVYHLVNTGEPVSRYAVAQKILEYAGLTSCVLEPVPSSFFPLPAPRPRMEAARNLRAELLGLNLMRPWQEALRAYLAEFTM